MFAPYFKLRVNAVSLTMTMIIVLPYPQVCYCNHDNKHPLFLMKDPNPDLSPTQTSSNQPFTIALSQHKRGFPRS